MAVKTLFLVSSILAASTLSAAAIEPLNPHDVLNKTRRDMNAFDQRMKGYKAEQQKKEKEAEAKRKNEEAERQKRENAEKALQEAQSRKEEAEKQKREKAEKAVQDAQLKREAAEQRKREREAKAQQAAQKKRDAAAAKPAQGASPSPVPTIPPPSSTGVSDPSSTSQP